MAARSILPNTAAHLLQPLQGPKGHVLRVKWHPEFDSHVCYLNDSAIAAHHNGFSCFALAERILAVWKGERDAPHALQQFDYILACGGLGTRRESIEAVLALGA